LANQEYSIEQSDCLLILTKLASDSIDSIVTDPPAGIGLQGFDWDQDRGGRDQWVQWLTSIMKECLRVLKPGAHGFVWALPRTSHWTATALENAGFEIRDIVTHIFGSGFPKSMDLEKSIARAKHLDLDLLYQATAWIRERRDELGLTNAELDQIAEIKGGASHWTAKPPSNQPAVPTLERWQLLEKVLGPAPAWMMPLLLPAHTKGENDELAKTWKGWGTGLKPASEHWILIQKPIASPSVGINLLKHGTGALNIDACRIPTTTKIPDARLLPFKGGRFLWEKSSTPRTQVYKAHPQGRHPANLLLTKNYDTGNCPVRILDEDSYNNRKISEYFKVFPPDRPFIYSKKASGLEKGESNIHPTVKPLKLMQYLTKLITPPGGVVLDPFMGSGSTGVACLKENFRFIGIEKSEEYFEIAKARLEEEFFRKEKELCQKKV
jgi:DNA modification methylase